MRVWVAPAASVYRCRKRLQDSADTAWHGIPSIGGDGTGATAAAAVREVHTKEQAVEKPLWKRVLLCLLAAVAGISFTLRIHQVLELLLFCHSSTASGASGSTASPTDRSATPLYPTRCFGGAFFVCPPAFTMSFLVIGRCFGIGTTTQQLAEAAWHRLLPPNLFIMARQHVFSIFDTQDTRQIKSATVQSASAQSTMVDPSLRNTTGDQNRGSADNSSLLRPDPGMPHSMESPTSQIALSRRRGTRARARQPLAQEPITYSAPSDGPLAGVAVSAAGKVMETDRVKIF